MVELITEAKEATVLRGFTDRKIKSNRPDIVVEGYKRKNVFKLNISVPTDNNISVKNRIGKHKELKIEIEKM